MGQKSRAKKEARLQKQKDRGKQLRAFIAKSDQVRDQYAKNWSESHAALFTAAGHYQWMAEFVKGRHLVLEIGTGDGSGTIALCANGSIVVSIDNNSFCLKRAYQNLTNTGFPVVYEERGNIAVNNDGPPRICHRKVTSSMPERGALLLDGDILADDELDKWLREQPSFDAVLCWNIGASTFDVSVANDVAQYRLRVQNRVYELADVLLKKGGILHIVDRGRPLLPGKETEQRATMIEGYTDQASVTSLWVNQDMGIRPYTPPLEGSGVNMVALDTTKFDYDPNKLAFWSIISEKP